MFYLEEIHAIQHPYQNNQGPLWYTDDVTKIMGLDAFFTEWKKSKNWTNTKYCLWVWMSLQICLIGTNLKVLAVFFVFLFAVF